MIKAMIIQSIIEAAKQDKTGRGWIVGAFLDPSSPYYSDDFEIGYEEISKLKFGDRRTHIHERTDEITIVLRGSLEVVVGDTQCVIRTMGVIIVPAGTIVRRVSVGKGTKLLMIKIPSNPGDKHYLE